MFCQHHRYIKSATSLALALGLYAAPLAGAHPQRLAKHEAAITASRSQEVTVGRPNPDEQGTWDRSRPPVIVRVAGPDCSVH